MEINERQEGDVVILSLSGRIDAYTSDLVREEIDTIINTGRFKIVVDFEKVNYISSSGLRVFLAAHKRASKNGGAVRLSTMSEGVAKVFKLAGFDKIFKSYAKVDEAVKQGW